MLKRSTNSSDLQSSQDLAMKSENSPAIRFDLAIKKKPVVGQTVRNKQAAHDVAASVVATHPQVNKDMRMAIGSIASVEKMMAEINKRNPLTMDITRRLRRLKQLAVDLVGQFIVTPNLNLVKQLQHIKNFRNNAINRCRIFLSVQLSNQLCSPGKSNCFK